MTGLYFNHEGRTYSLRLRCVEDEADAVWEALVDGATYLYFEAPVNTEIWTLFGYAIAQFVEYRSSTEVVTSEWRKP
jgi:hypothetical protein